MYGVAVVIATLGGLIYLAYRGVTLLILAPSLAILVVLASFERPLLASYTQIFMIAMGDFVVQYFPIFLLGAIFGKLMEDTGSAEVLANATIRKLGSNRAILSVVLSCAAMTYGGVSLFVVAFAVFPIAAAVFRQANLPKRLIPGTIALGAFTYHDCAAWHAGDPERDTNALFRHIAFCRARTRHRDGFDHVCAWSTMVGVSGAAHLCGLWRLPGHGTPRG